MTVRETVTYSTTFNYSFFQESSISRDSSDEEPLVPCHGKQVPAEVTLHLREGSTQNLPSGTFHSMGSPKLLYLGQQEVSNAGDREEFTYNVLLELEKVQIFTSSHLSSF